MGPPNEGEASSQIEPMVQNYSVIRKHPVRGPRQAVLVITLLLGLLFSSLDTSIAATSLVTISNDLQDFVNAPWIILAYLLTYMGFAVFISKLSDIYGRRNMLVFSWVVFVAFSLGCANADTMTALIICRAFQGVGASGLYSLTQIGLAEVGPAHKPSAIGGMIGATLALAFVLGPIIGGAVSHLSSWRWLFNLNIPFGLVTILIITHFWPNEDVDHFFSRRAFARIDFLGGATLICSSGLLVFALQQGGSRTFSWLSAPIVTTLIISAVAWVGFVCWEMALEIKKWRNIEPIFPLRLLRFRVYSAGLLVTFLTGFPYIALVIILPERFQIVGDEGVMMAGVQILPTLGGCAFGSFFGGAISRNRNNTGPTLVLASTLQLLGTGLMLMDPSDSGYPARQYAFQVLFGLGVGLSFSAATIMTHLVPAKENERASAQGAVAQARVLGGCIGLSVCTIIFNLHFDKYLQDKLSPKAFETLLKTPLAGRKLPREQLTLFRGVYANAYQQEIKVMIGMCALMVVVSLFTLERHPAPLERLTTQAPVKDERRGSDSGTEMTNMGRRDDDEEQQQRI